MSLAVARHCEVCAGELDGELLRTGPLKKVCLECLSPLQKQELERDLEAAGRIQAALLPERSAHIGDWRFDYHYFASASRFFRRHAPVPVLPILIGVAVRAIRHLAHGDLPRVRAALRGARQVEPVRALVETL